MDLGAVRTQLDELGVDASSLRIVIVEDAPDVVLAFDVDPSTWFDTWQQLRKGVGALGMWPLATWELYGPPEKISRFETQGPDGLDASPRAIISRVPEVDVDQLLDAEQAAQHEQTKSWADYESHLASTVTRAAIDGVDITLLHRELGPSPDHVDVERWLLDIELKRGLNPDPNHRDGYLDWFVPPEAVMLLLPTTLPWPPAPMLRASSGATHTPTCEQLCCVVGTNDTEPRWPPTGGQCSNSLCTSRPPRSSRHGQQPARSTCYGPTP